jgi:hypothetical protein
VEEVEANSAPKPFNPKDKLMKAEIAIPRPVSEAAEQLAQTLGMSLSELYMAAVTAHVTVHQCSEIAVS